MNELRRQLDLLDFVPPGETVALQIQNRSEMTSPSSGTLSRISLDDAASWVVLLFRIRRRDGTSYTFVDRPMDGEVFASLVFGEVSEAALLPSKYGSWTFSAPHDHRPRLALPLLVPATSDLRKPFVCDPWFDEIVLHAKNISDGSRPFSLGLHGTEL